MESLSRPFHRRKPSNANAFSGKNAYDGVFSGHRPNYDGAPAVNVDDYREIFSTSGASIPVIDLSNLEESSGELNSEVRSTSPDYGRIFGGFRDLDIAISYEELVARDTARAPSSTSQGSQDSGDMSHQTSDALKQFNLSYNKISQRSKDGLDGTTHVTQLHAVNGFTCFVDESASQTNKETVKQKASSSNNVNVNSATNNVNVNSSEREVPEKQTATNNVNVNSSNRDVPEKQTATNNVNVNSSNRDVPEKQTSINNVNVNVNSSKRGVPEKQIATNNVNVNSSKRDAPEKQATINNVNVNSSKREVPEKQTAINNVNVNSSKREVPEKQTAINNINVNSSKLDAPEKQTTINNVNVNSSKRGVPEKQTATNNVNVNSSNRDVPEKRAATNNVNVNSKVLSSPEAKKETKKQKPPATNIVPSSLPAASQPKKETEKQKPPETNNVPSSPPAASQPKKETEKQKFSVTNNVRPSEKVDFPVKQTSQTAIKSQSGYGQDEAFSNNKNFKTFQADFKSYPSKVSSSHAASTTNLDNHKSYQKRSTTTNEEFPPSLDEEVVVNSAAAALKKAIEKAQESIRIAKESVGRKKEGLKGFSSKSFKDSLKVKARVANVYAGEEDKEKDDKMKDRDHKNGNFSDGEKLFAPKKVINEIHGKVSESVKISEIPVTSRFELNDNKMVCNSKQVVEEHKEKDDKTKERDHKNGNFSDSEKLFGPKKVINEIHGKVSESVKISEIPVTSFELNDNKMVCNSKQVVEEHKGKDDKVKERDHKNGNFFDGEKLFGPKKVITEIHGKVSESVKISEIPVTSRFELNDNKMVCQSKQVGETETKSGENNACENPQKDDKRPDGFLVLESCETKQEDIESNNLTLCQKAETKKEISQTSDQNGYEKKFSEESFGLLENNVQENLEHEHDHKVATADRQDEDEDEDERQVKGDGGTEIHSEEEKFYDSSQREDYENHEAEEAYENSSSDYDDAEENDNATGTSNMDDTEKACKVDQNVNNAEICQEIDDVSSRREFQVENTEAVEKEAFENMSSDETEENKNEHEEKSDHLENCGLADVDFAQNGVQLESSLDSIHGMEIEVKEYKEREETVEKEENNFQESREQTPEIRIEMDTGTPQEPKDAHREPEPSEPSRAAHHKEEMERERIKLAVDRAIREARERAFAEVRQRVIADTQEKVTKASIDKTSAQSKLKAERALVERATAEARQRALEKYEKQTSSASQTNTESALRSKAKLEKHNRIMERAAKALAEKEKRDLLVLREQAERNRLAEYLDADIKRWSTGKEGNLRALLSTLQYILGADSGWQAVSLTEIITTSAVKKAYRKATLCVHPDKLQQRGASIQQKYICEKVFDLLKAAWNRFNSEER